MSEWLGWHFNVNRRLANGDGRYIKTGVTHRIKGPLMLCENGLHASARVIDALLYAPYDTTHVARVQLSGERLDDNDKSAAIERTYLAVIPIRPVLDEFACRCAEAALIIADINNEQCWQVIHIKREWLAGRATDLDLAAARDAAWDAVGAAVGDAAWDAVGDAAWDAVGDAAWDAVGAAANAAARAAARAAAWAAVGDAVGDAVRDAVGAAANAAARAAAWDAVGAAAWAAAWDAVGAAAQDAGAAARDEINDLLESMLLEAMNLKS